MKSRLLISKTEVTIGRFTVPVRLYGENGPPIVCLNGIQQSMAIWQSLVSRFSNEYRIALFDFPGQGRGRFLEGPHNLSINEQVDILHGVLNAARFKSDTILCTASWGGVVALAYAAHYPEAVQRLILGSIGARPNQKMVETIQKGLSIDTHNRKEMAEVLIKSFGQDLPQAVKERITLQFHTMSDETLKTFSDHGRSVLTAGSLMDTINLPKIKAETILLRGKNDRIIDSDDVYNLAAKIPRCTVKIINNVGHFMHLEREDIFDIYSSAFKGELK